MDLHSISKTILDKFDEVIVLYPSPYANVWVLYDGRWKKNGQSMIGKFFAEVSKHLFSSEREKLVQLHIRKASVIPSDWIYPENNFPYDKFPLWRIKLSDWLKEKIRERDNYRCQQCGIDQANLDQQLHVHHIIPRTPFRPPNNHPDNLISLCYSCHRDVHTMGFTDLPVHPFIYDTYK